MVAWEVEVVSVCEILLYARRKHQQEGAVCCTTRTGFFASRSLPWSLNRHLFGRPSAMSASRTQALLHRKTRERCISNNDRLLPSSTPSNSTAPD